MSKFNIGHITGVTVNTTEALVNKVKEDVPAAKNTAKKGLKGWKDSVKAEYNTARNGMQIGDKVGNPVTRVQDQVARRRLEESIAARAIELTTGGK